MNIKELTSYALKYIKSSPVDIYNEYTDELDVSSFELVSSRPTQLDDENSVYIGSGNLFLAVILSTCKYYNLKTLTELDKDKIDNFQENIWPKMLEDLVDRNIIKNLSGSELFEVPKVDYLRVVVDNTK